MRVGIFSRWNATCGISFHAELLVKEFMARGVELVVFAPRLSSANRWWHHRIIKSDEEFVVRCYDELDPLTGKGGAIDEREILGRNLEFLVIESYHCAPQRELEGLVQKLKAKGVKTLLIAHESSTRELKYSNPRLFDAVVVFDERFVKEVWRGYEDLVRIVPYPCHGVVEGNRDFGEGGLRFFSFGRQPVEEYTDYLIALDAFSKDHSFTYRVIRSNGLLPFKRRWLIQERGRPQLQELYKYLHSSDVHLLPKGKAWRGAVVSSALCQCLGSLCLTVVPYSRFSEALPEFEGSKPVVVYERVDDLVGKLHELVEDKSYRLKIKRAARTYVEERRSDKIADELIHLLKSL